MLTLVIEKLCKAQWVKTNFENTPPRIHNLVTLVLKSIIVLEETDLQFLAEFNEFQLEGRYPDYQFKIYKRCTLEYTEELLKRVESIKIWLQEKI